MVLYMAYSERHNGDRAGLVDREDGTANVMYVE